MAAALNSDRTIGRLARDLEPSPADQARVFRGHLVDSGSTCILKIGLGELEAVWMPEISSRTTDIVAHVISSGALPQSTERWLLLEDLPFRARSDRRQDVTGVMRCTARFQQVAAAISLPTYPIDVEFVQTYGRQAITAGCPGPARQVLSRAADDDAWLRSLHNHTTGHGDVHFWNAVAATADGPWRLIDPIPRTAHWAWDAAYAQLTSGVPDTPDLISVLAGERRRLGLPTEDGDQLQRVRTLLLGWSSLLWWALLVPRRTEPWWQDQVEKNVGALTRLRL